MEKIININFQGRVIPIEETAYNKLKQYIDSLRRHFANEESGDEIINDIENRIAELFTERLKRGALCIGGNDVSDVIASIGSLDEIEAAEGEENKNTKNTYTPPSQGAHVYNNQGRFVRNADDKVIAGVCSGIANRTGVDPAVIRILFVLLFGALFWIYILLWIIVPSQSIHTNITRRLFRNPDDKVISGVCGGLAAYFRIDSWVPRLIFALPLVLGIISGGMHLFWWHGWWGLGPRIFTGSFGSTLFIAYIILWIVLPYASSASDKLEMRGEKVDMNSIKAATQARAASGSTYTPRPVGSGIGRVIGIIFKAFFLFIAGVMAVSLFGVLIGLIFGGIVAFPFTNFLLGGWQQYSLVWAGIILFIGIPLLAFITWAIRRLIGVRSRHHYLGYIFGGLWVIGLISVIVLAAWLMNDFSSRSVVEEAYSINQPSTGKLYVNVADGHTIGYRYHYWRFGDWDEDGNPFLVGKDSLLLNTVRVNVTQSGDSLFHIYEARISRGSTSEEAKNTANHISFSMRQLDSMINLPRGFTISNKDKFRNQQVMIIVEMPVGKKIEFNKNIDNYDWFTINVNRPREFNFEHDWNDDYRSNTEYIMTPSGLKRTSNASITDSDNDDNDEE